MPKWIIKWAPQFLGQANKKDLLAESRSSSSRQESCEQNVESGWFRAVLIPEHKFWRLAGGRRSPTPMTLHLRIAGRQKIFSKNLKKQKKSNKHAGVSMIFLGVDQNRKILSPTCLVSCDIEQSAAAPSMFEWLLSVGLSTLVGHHLHLCNILSSKCPRPNIDCSMQ